MAAYCHLIETCEGAESPYGIVLYPDSYECVTVPNSPENQNKLHSGLLRARKIIRAAQLYLQRNRQFRERPCRFDVIAISPSQSSADVNIQWLQSAFIS